VADLKLCVCAFNVNGAVYKFFIVSLEHCKHRWTTATFFNFYKKKRGGGIRNPYGDRVQVLPTLPSCIAVTDQIMISSMSVVS